MKPNLGFLRGQLCVTLLAWVAVASPVSRNGTSGFCGDGFCTTPEFVDSCPSDCGELVRNSRMLSHGSGLLPFFWRRNNLPSDPIQAFVNMPNSGFPLRFGEMISQSGVMFLPAQEYTINLNVSDPLCLEVFIHSVSSVLFARSNVTRSEWISPESDQDLTFSLRSTCPLVSVWLVSVQPKPISLNTGWKYSEIVDSILPVPERIDPERCYANCVANAECCAWQVCPGTELEGCQGCYLLNRKPNESVTKEGWFSGIVRSESAQASIVLGCRDWFLGQSSHESDFYDEKSGKLAKYLECGRILRNDKSVIPKQVFLGGIHLPTILVVNHRTPSPRLGASSEIAYFFVLPFYDTNIGNVIKHTSSMNIVQSYEMQSILASGEVFVDVGANLGSYTIPLADHLGISGKVFAFEPFRWMHQLLNANIALNGLMNCHTFAVALSDVSQRSLLLQPNLRHFSSPGGVKVAGQPTDSNNMYDASWGREWVQEALLDDIIMGDDLLSVDLIKIDVEGMETKVVLGARRVLAKFAPIVWSENVAWFESGDETFLDLMDSLNYLCWKSTHAGNDLICEPKNGSRSHRLNRVGKEKLDWPKVLLEETCV